MKLPQVVPPPDLLAHVEGVESTLRTGKRLGNVGWLAFVVSVVQVSALVISSDWWQGIGDVEWSGLDENWPVVASTLLLIVSVLLINWTRFWVRESRAPFRYTYSIGPYEPLGNTEEQPRLHWLREDLSERLDQRIGRLSLLDEEAAAANESHIHVFGSYGIRRSSEGSCAIEVFSWIRLGPGDAPATLAHPVKFHLPLGEGQLQGEDGAQAYEKLIERIYFSIATHLYRQIREDVRKKIQLLPKRYFRAAAYFYEAEDYVGSNTLDAYGEAEQLYAEVVKLYDPTWVEGGHSAFQRMGRSVGRALGTWALFWRRWVARAWPRLGSVELMVARAEIGYANTRLYRRALAGLSGQRLNPIFDARPVAENAVTRLERLGQDVRGRNSALFDARVTLANAYASLGSIAEANQQLDKAQERDPARAEQDARFLYVKGRGVPRQPAQFFLRAIELEPTFEVAQFELALAVERMWRRRRVLEPSVADMIGEEYERVLTLNPGNIAAWASLGYMHWLLAEQGDEREREARLDRAEQYLKRGREYKEIKRETFVAELDYGLARIAAERGDFKLAYRRYIEAVSAHFAQGVSHAPDGYTTSHFEGITPFILGRFDTYRRRVREQWEREQRDPAKQAASRVRDAVYAFVLNDFGEACLNYYLRSGDEGYLGKARKTLNEASEKLNTRYPMISYNLNRLERWEASPIGRIEEVVQSDARVESILLDVGSIERVIRYEPYWPDGQLEMALSDLTRAVQARWVADELSKPAGDHEREAAKYESEAQQKERSAKDVLRLLELPWPILLHDAMRDIEQPLSAATTPAMVTSVADALVRRRLEPPAGEWPRPQPEGEALLREIRELRGRAEWHKAKVERLQVLAGRLREEANKGAQRASQVPKMLLPHEWLWKGDRFDWSVLERKDLTRQRRWERELDDLHVKALYALYRSVRTPAKPDDGESEAAERIGGTEEEAWKLLRHLREHFWPSDFDFLRESRDDPAPRDDDFDGLFRARIVNDANRDAAFSTLHRVAYFTFFDALFEARKSVELFRSAVEERDLPAPLYCWLGLWLYNLTSEDFGLDEDTRKACRESALKAFDNAAASDDPAMLFKVGRELEKREHWEGSLEAYSRAMDLDARSEQPVNSADDYRVAIGRVLWKLERYPEAVERLEAATGQVSWGNERWRTELIARLLGEGAVTSVRQYRLLKNWLGRQLTAAHVGQDEATQSDAAAALLHLTHDLYMSQVRRPDDPHAEELALALTATVAPIVVEAHDDLLPDAGGEVEPEGADGLEGAGERKELLREIGVELPQIGILASPKLGPNRYRMRLDEVPVEDGEFRADEWLFAPVGKEARQHGLRGHEGANPLGGQPGLWLEDEGQTREAGLEVWDRYTFMLRRAKALLLRNLTFQQCEDLLEAWVDRDPDERVRLRKGALPDEAAHIRLAAVLRALLREGVSVHALWDDLAAILRIVESAPTSIETRELTERVRLALCATLPGTEDWRRVIILRPELEDEVARVVQAQDGKRFLALRTPKLDDLRGALRADLPADAAVWRSAIAVLTPGLRPFVRALVALDHPTLPVVAFTELPEGRRLASEQRLTGVPTLAPR